MPSPQSTVARDLSLALLGTAVFVYLATVSLGPVAPTADLWIRQTVHALSSAPLTALMKFVTTLGSGWFLWIFGILITGALLRAGRRREAALFAITVLGSNILNEGMKIAFHRARPDPYFGYLKPESFSFPSGHSLVSFCFYLALAEVLIDAEWSHRRRIAIFCAALFLTLTIGLSRIYLGVHYPSDVAAGYAAAVAWTFAVRSAVGLLAHKSRA